MPISKMAIPNIGVMIVLMRCLFIEILRESDIEDKRLFNRINSKDGVSDQPCIDHGITVLCTASGDSRYTSRQNRDWCDW
ncbi:hypothetical protein TUM4644_06930 [Shewanella colwelliana]|nr:hypothetical protein TUM4644_06930 [Shewanella colwelliana]